MFNFHNNKGYKRNGFVQIKKWPKVNILMSIKKEKQLSDLIQIIVMSATVNMKETEK